MGETCGQKDDELFVLNKKNIYIYYILYYYIYTDRNYQGLDYFHLFFRNLKLNIAVDY